MTTLHTEVLKPLPCPFCGNPHCFAMTDECNSQWYVACTSCNIEGPPSGYEDQAIHYWNQRTPQPDAAAIRKAALDMAAKFVGPIVAAETSMPLARIDKLQDAIRALSTTLVEPAISTFDYQAEIARLVKLNDDLRANERRLIDELEKATLSDAKNFCPDCGQRNNGDLVHTCSPQTLDAIRSKTQDAPSAINVPDEWRDAVQEFVNKCDTGEIRSKKTYAKFKALLAASPIQSKDA